jgi:hypothetical protein
MAANGVASTQEARMRYLLLIYGDESTYGSMSEADVQADMQKWWEYDAAIKSAGASSSGEALQPTATATTVRDDNGSPLVTDGPFAETREQLGGYYVLDVENLDEAIKWAHRCPGIEYGTIELRPIQEFEQG